MEWFYKPFRIVFRYVSYLWDGLKGRWKALNRIGLYAFIVGFFKNFVESWVLTKIDIEDGYI